MNESRRVVVIGSGPPGAAAAVFLSRGGADVLLLEAGRRRDSWGLTVRVGGLTVVRMHRPLRMRPNVQPTADPDAGVFEEVAPGGLSNHWSCAVPRFAAEDFADARRGGEAHAWPIGYDDVAPWYESVEPLLHIAGPAQGSDLLPAGTVRHAWRLSDDWAGVEREARGAGRAVTAMPYAYGADTTASPTGNVFNAFVRLVRPEMRTGRIAVRYDARAARLEWSPVTRRVEAVILRRGATGAEERLPCRAVVLAAGAVGTPEILLASSSAEFPEGLGNTHGVLGRYFHDHPLAKVVVDVNAPMKVHPPCYVTRQGLDRAPPLYAAACMQWSGVSLLARSLRARTPWRLPWLGFNVFGTMPPSPDDRVAFDDTRRRADGTPSLRLHLRHPPEAREALDRARDDLVGILARAGLDPRVRSWTPTPPGTSVHYGGTCRMHASPRFGMVDRWSRLHAVSNVVVADSSAFTTGPEKNPVLTSMALAARAADRLARDLGAGDL